MNEEAAIHPMDPRGALLVGVLVDMIRRDPDGYRSLAHDLIHAVCDFYGSAQLSVELARTAVTAMQSLSRIESDAFELHKDEGFWTYTLSGNLNDASRAAYERTIRCVLEFQALVDDVGAALPDRDVPLSEIQVPQHLEGRIDGWVGTFAPGNCGEFLALTAVAACAVAALVAVADA